MHILIVSQYFWPENFKINDLAEELVRRGHRVTVLTGKPNYPSGEVLEDFRKDPAHYAFLNGVEIVRIPMLARGRGSLRLALNYACFAASACLFGPWKLRKVRVDAIFVFQVSPGTVGVPAVLLKYLKRTRLVLWIQDLWPETLDAIGITKGGLPVWLIGEMMSFIYKNCDLVLAQSRSFVPLVQGRTDKPESVVYFPGWADPPSGAAVDRAPEIALRPDTFTIMFAGNVGVAQDLPAVLRAAAIVKQNRPDIRWIIVGDGRMFDFVEAEVARLDLGGQVTLAGRFPPERMTSFYRHADALLVSLQDKPIFAMTIPSKVQSYLQSGIPILCMVGGETAEIVTRSGAGLAVSPGDSDGLARAVTAMADLSENDRKAMGEQGKAYAAREFDRGNLIARLEGYFKRLTGQPS
ncbi:glycosyltransferase family 4 protein [Devosia sp. Root635]|uniref:glycosyltransferase family 4 protein n=1 Tax=Devosia sp. Root635 TaxID=1736575 RepID=UPI000700C41D|nr:glycosyltransferase family 4 protein [Devosia sp. Root635]KRA55362.1 hypothetical protein ASD80_13205 [Devosia sp. Root635]